MISSCSDDDNLDLHLGRYCLVGTVSSRGYCLISDSDNPNGFRDATESIWPRRDRYSSDIAVGAVGAVFNASDRALNFLLISVPVIAYCFNLSRFNMNS